MGRKRLIAVLGPTAVGKTEITLRLAQRLGASIVSADSRQIYKGMSIGTAAPTKEELGAVPHFFVGTLEPTQEYSAARYGVEARAVIEKLLETNDTVLMTGGSSLYIDAALGRLDDLPTILPETRRQVNSRLESEGLESLVAELERLDPVSYGRVDLKNPRRVTHALEVCLQSGRPYSSFLVGGGPALPFDVVKIGIVRPREELYERIDRRVEAMIEGGLVDEVRRLEPLRGMNALNTVGYVEVLSYLDGCISLDEAVRLIRRNTRVYARKQQTWLRRQNDVVWFRADKVEAVERFVVRSEVAKCGMVVKKRGK